MEVNYRMVFIFEAVYNTSLTVSLARSIVLFDGIDTTEGVNICNELRARNESLRHDILIAYNTNISVIDPDYHTDKRIRQNKDNPN